VSLVLAAAAILLAAVHTVPLAVRLGTRRDPIAEQRRIAARIGRDHVACFAAIAGLLAIQLA
jgi:hypothetical protein